jgi:replicative DNA helicase
MSKLWLTSSEANQASLEDIEYRRQNKHLAVTIGVPEIDEVFYPAMKGELVCLIARPGHAKTGVMVAMYRKRAEIIRANNLDRFTVYVTAEDVVEQLNNFIIAANTGISATKMAKGDVTDDEFARIKHTVAVSLGPNPYSFFIGYSEKNRKDQPKLTVENITGAIMDIERETGLKPDSVYVDYLQLLSDSKWRESKTVTTEQNLKECKEGTRVTGCPWFLGVQARREVDNYDPPIPTESDGQWTSGIEQYSQRLISLVRPRKVKREGDWFGEYKVRGINQLLFVIWKQKLGEPNRQFMIQYDPRYNILDSLDESMAVPDDEEPIF